MYRDPLLEFCSQLFLVTSGETSLEHRHPESSIGVTFVPTVHFPSCQQANVVDIIIHNL